MGFSPGGILKQRNQFELEASGADQIPRAAPLVKGSQPSAEGRRILLPSAAGSRAQELGRVSAEQLVGFHGQRGQPMTRAFQQRG